VCKKEIEIKEDSRLYSSQTKLNNYTIFRECSECKQKRRQILIDKLTEINIERKEKGIVVPFKIPQHLRDKARQRMLLNNPMFSPDIRKKASDTIQERIKSGELIYKKGKEHHLFDKRCKHKLYYVARSRLYQFWTKPVMQRDGFKCKLCGISGRLQVHHLIPFIQIFNSILEENGITTECANNLLNENYEKFEQLVSKIVSRHKLEDGITVCKNCHIDIDNHYRVKKEKTRTFLYENKKDYRSYI
jgi:5-methylcytosine-specific restriction endonuclease McrA